MAERSIFTPLQQKLLERCEVHISGPIDDDMADYVHEAFLHLRAEGNPDVDIYLRSEGGDFVSALHIYDEIRFYQGKTRGILNGFAYSGAAIDLQACTERWSYPHGSLLIHNGKSTDRHPKEDFAHARKRQDIIRRFDLAQRMMYDIFTRRTGKTENAIRILCERNQVMTAEQAKKFGLIDHIMMPPSR